MAAIGGIVAVVSLAGVCAAAASAAPCGCGDGRARATYHWQLADPRPLRWPVLAVGQAGLWELTAAVAGGVARLLADDTVRARR